MNSLFTVLNEQKLIHETFNFTHTTSSIIDAILDILTVQLLKIPDFTDVKPCHWDSLKHCRALLFRGWEVLGLKTSETTHPMTMHHIPENLTLQHYLYCGNLLRHFSYICENQLLALSCQSICLHVTTWLPLDGVHEIWYLTIFQKNYPENSNFIKTGQE